MEDLGVGKFGYPCFETNPHKTDFAKNLGRSFSYLTKRRNSCGIRAVAVVSFWKYTPYGAAQN